jgi:hypothetical protein
MPRGRPKVTGKKRVNLNLKLETVAEIKRRVVQGDRKLNTQGKVIDEQFKP